MANTCTKVFLRKRPYAGGRLSLYLDYYPAVMNPHTRRLTRRETLGIVIFANPVNEQQRLFNREMEEKAEAIRCIRYQNLVNEQFGFLDRAKLQQDFLAYFERMARCRCSKWRCSYLHFRKFMNGKCVAGDINAALCSGFRAYLLCAVTLRHPGRPCRLAVNSAAAYWSAFRMLLKLAFNDKLILEDVGAGLSGIRGREVKKGYITIDEMRRLDATPCEIPVLKRASMFGLFTGLRLGDLLKLRWDNIVLSSDKGYCLRLRTEKTGMEVTLPVSEEALAYCGSRGEGLVFEGFRRHMAQHAFKKWVRKAGIGKTLSFHCLRHSFATNLIALGVDIYVVSKMLAHRSIRSTQIYADVVSEQKRRASEVITLR